MLLFRIYNKWDGEFFLITAKSKERAIEIMDENNLFQLKKSREDCLKHGGDPETIDEFLTNKKYRYSMYIGEEINGNLTKEGIIDSYIDNDDNLEITF